jgi:hypothetical protein
MGNNWVIPKDFQNKKHCNNFINSVCKRQGYSLDEVFEIGYLKNEKYETNGNKIK